MRRALHSVLLSAAVVPVLLAVPVAATVSAPTADAADAGHTVAAPRVRTATVAGRVTPSRPVAPTVRRLAVAGVDPAMLAQLRTATARTAPAGTAPAVVAPAVLTAPLTTARFDLVALGWRATATATATATGHGAGTVSGAWVRVRENGVWSGWTALDGADGATSGATGATNGATGATSGDGRDGGDGPDATGPDAVGAARVAATGARTTAPLLTGGADGVQVRVDTATGVPPADLALDLVDGGRSPGDTTGTHAPVAGALAAGTSQPQIIGRAEWGADERLVKSAPVINTSVKALVVHHTDTSNAYSPDQAFAQVRSLYAFHTKVRGWNDLGYNFVVDRFGRTFEGRRGSITQPVMGAHAGGFNAQTLGVAVLGTFSSVSLPTGADAALPQLLAWQAATYGINPAGRTTLISAGGSYTRYAAGTPVGVYGVSGHRDVDSTECPGNAAYPRLASLRARSAALMVPGLVEPVLTDVPTTVDGSPVTFTAVTPTRQRWWLTVTTLCGTTPVRIVSGTSTGRIAGSWDLRDAAGSPVPPGAYRVTVTSSSPVGWVAPYVRDVEVLATPASLAGSATTGGTSGGTSGGTPSPSATPSGSPTPTPTPTPSPSPSGGGSSSPPVAASNGCAVLRAAGADPALTSVVAGRLARPDARSVVLVNGSTAEGLAQALGAGPLAASLSAPLLLTGAGALPAVVAQDVTARRVTTAWLVGSTAVISADVEKQLRDLGVTTVTRVAGPDRWSTAAAVAALVRAPAHRAVLVSGDPGERLDALVAAGSAASAGLPVLLTSRTGVPAATLAQLRSLHVTTVTVIGSTVAVPEATLRALAGAGVTHRTRLVGRDRWRTAVAVADQLGAAAPADRVVLAAGMEAGADLLVASGQARRILLTAAAELPGVTADWLRAHRAPGVTLVARPGAVSTSVLSAVRQARSS